jgi:hypothetical protein
VILKAGQPTFMAVGNVLQRGHTMRLISRLLRDRYRALGFWQGMTLECPRIGDSGVVRVHGFGTSASLGNQARA